MKARLWIQAEYSAGRYITHTNLMFDLEDRGPLARTLSTLGARGLDRMLAPDVAELYGMIDEPTYGTAEWREWSSFGNFLGYLQEWQAPGVQVRFVVR